MSAFVLAAASVIAVGLVAIMVGRAVVCYFRLRGTRLVTCPETRERVAVELDTVRSAIGEALGQEGFRLHDCSRWPERQDCGRQCLREIESAPEACLVRSILARWYEGKSCVLCGRDLGVIRHLERHPAFMARDGATSEWRELEPARLPEVLTSHSPICWGCHVAESFRRRFPELVTDRSNVHAGTQPPAAGA